MGSLPAGAAWLGQLVLSCGPGSSLGRVASGLSLLPFSATGDVSCVSLTWTWLPASDLDREGDSSTSQTTISQFLSSPPTSGSSVGTSSSLSFAQSAAWFCWPGMLSSCMGDSSLPAGEATVTTNLAVDGSEACVGELAPSSSLLLTETGRSLSPSVLLGEGVFLHGWRRCVCREAQVTLNELNGVTEKIRHEPGERTKPKPRQPNNKNTTKAPKQANQTKRARISSGLYEPKRLS